MGLVQKILTWIVKRVLSLVVCVVVLALGVSWLVMRGFSSERIETVETVPARQVTLVLGAAMWDDGPSPYLQARLEVAAALYHAGKTEVIIVSGTQDGGYSEPDGMKAWLVSAGVPAGRIVLDPQGDDTYSSCSRAREVYRVKSLIVVTQDFHLPRAITACRLLEIDTVGVPDTQRARNMEYRGYQARELPANVKVLFDVVTGRSVSGDGERDAVAEALQTPR
ncbi:MAG: YdcF family protein [Propionibacteriaceae bacterium]|nr:YdcF family protein [Propionibacteriaceae bacterium]